MHTCQAAHGPGEVLLSLWFKTRGEHCLGNAELAAIETLHPCLFFPALIG